MPDLEDFAAALLTGAGGTSLAISPPAGTVAGHRLAAVLAWRGQGAVTPGQSGWSERHDLTVTNGPSGALYDRVVAAGDPASYTFGFSGAAARAVGIIARIGGSAAVEDSGQNSGAGTTLTAPSLPSLGAGRLLLTVWIRTHGEVFTGLPPAGMATEWDVSSGGAVAGAVEQAAATQIVGPGATGTRSVGLSTARNWVAFSVLYRPDPGYPGGAGGAGLAGLIGAAHGDPANPGVVGPRAARSLPGAVV